MDELYQRYVRGQLRLRDDSLSAPPRYDAGIRSSLPFIQAALFRDNADEVLVVISSGDSYPALLVKRSRNSI